ncbi:MAG: pinensin family lanthipeptide [Rhodothermaceae bacterium]
MKKQKLKINDLQIESFTTSATPKTRGTIKGFKPISEQYWCPPETERTLCFSYCATCAPTCGGLTEDPEECP